MRQNLTSSLWIWATWTWMTEQTFPESPRHFLFKVSMSLSHYHSHIQPLDKQPCLFWEHTHRHTHKKKAMKEPWVPPRCADQLTGVTTKRDRAHVECVVGDSGCAEQVKFPPLQETQGTWPGQSVLPAEMDIGQGTNSRAENRGILSSSKPSKTLHLTGSRVCNSI